MLVYYRMNGPQWQINSLWLSDESECLWYGVTCNGYNIVVNLDLRSNDLSGSIPSEIGELRGLESLTLSDNRINGLIPQEIEKLEALETLNISHNALKEKIPIQIFNLHSLIELDLSFNTLSGRISNDIGELKNILRMDLSNNLFSDQLPDQIYNLKKILSLSLSNNLFVGDVTRLGKLFQLESIELNNNIFTGKIPIGEEQNNLTKIDLSRNRFTGSIPSSIGKNIGLQVISFSHNKLTGYIPDEIGNLKDASLISMSFNRIKGTIPSGIRKLINLNLLHLHGNQIRGNADYIDKAIKSYITDCGKAFLYEALVKCDTCSECCTTDGDCLKVQDTWPNQDLKDMNLPPTIGVLGIAFGVAIAFFAICLLLKRFIGQRLPSLNFNAKAQFQEKSVCKFFLVSDWKAWLVAIVTVALQIYLLQVFIRASDFTHDMNDWEYSMSCQNDEELCDDVRFISIWCWIIFGMIICSFLFKDIADGLLLMYENITTTGKLKDLFAGIVVLYITSVLAVASTLYNYSTSVSETDLLKDAAVLLFLSFIDEKFFDIVEHVFPLWTERIKAEILER